MSTNKIIKQIELLNLKEIVLSVRVLLYCYFNKKKKINKKIYMHEWLNKSSNYCEWDD